MYVLYFCACAKEDINLFVVSVSICLLNGVDDSFVLLIYHVIVSKTINVFVCSVLVYTCQHMTPHVLCIYPQPSCGAPYAEQIQHLKHATLDATSAAQYLHHTMYWGMNAAGIDDVSPTRMEHERAQHPCTTYYYAAS